MIIIIIIIVIMIMITLAKQCVIVRAFFFFQPKSQILLQMLLRLKATVFAASNWQYKKNGNLLHFYSLMITRALTFE